MVERILWSFSTPTDCGRDQNVGKQLPSRGFLPSATKCSSLHTGLIPTMSLSSQCVKMEIDYINVVGVLEPSCEGEWTAYRDFIQLESCSQAYSPFWLTAESAWPAWPWASWLGICGIPIRKCVPSSSSFHLYLCKYSTQKYNCFLYENMMAIIGYPQEKTEEIGWESLFGRSLLSNHFKLLPNRYLIYFITNFLRFFLVVTQVSSSYVHTRSNCIFV